MFNRLKTKLAAAWHWLVNFLTTEERKFLMTIKSDVTDLVAKVDALTAAVAGIAAPTVDLSSVAKADALAAVAADVTAIKGETVA